MPVVSVIIPNYNNSSYLEKMINCLISQTYSSWELIVVDDVSTDDSAKMVSNYIQKDSRINLLIRNRDPKGGQTCRNIGFENCKGKYVVFFDSDDLISSFCLQQRVDFMEINHDIDFGIFPATIFTNEEEIESIKSLPCIYGKNRKYDVLSDFLRANYQFTVWTNIYRKESIKDIVWDEKIACLQDFDFNVTSLFANKKFSFCGPARIDYFYRSQRENSVCSTFVSPDKCNSTIYLFTKTLDSLRQRSDYKKRKKEFMQFIVLHFERLAMDGDILKMNDYLSFCERFYPVYIVNSLRLIYKISSRYHDRKLRRGTLYLLIALRFWYKKHFKTLLNQIRVI